MCKFLSKIRNLDPTVKKALAILVVAIAGPIPILVYILLVKLNSGNPKMFEFEIDCFKKIYPVFRKCAEGTKDPTISIGNYVDEYNGIALFDSKFISIYAMNITDSIVKDCSFIEKKQIRNDTYYQLPIKQNYSKKEKATIIRAVLDFIHTNYPEDNVAFDNSIPLAISEVGLNPTAELFLGTDEISKNNCSLDLINR